MLQRKDITSPPIYTENCFHNNSSRKQHKNLYKNKIKILHFGATFVDLKSNSALKSN